MARSSCSVDECDSLAKKRGLCGRHLQEAINGQRELPPRRIVQKRAEAEHCTIADCSVIAEAKGLCMKHYQRSRRGYISDQQAKNNRFKRDPICAVDECGKPHLAKGYCVNHWYRWRKHIAIDSDVRIRRTAEDCKRRDEHGRKHCIGCDTWLNTDSFGISRKSPDGLSSYCLNCISKKNRAQKLKSNYKITPEILEKMLGQQGHGCAICASEIGTLTAQVDHDHSCCAGKVTCGNCVRGLLCVSCNTGIGLLKDSVENLSAAIRYLQSFR